MVTREARDAGDEHAEEQAFVVLQHADEFAEFLNRGFQGPVGPDVVDNGCVVLVDQHHGFRFVNFRKVFNKGGQEFRR